MKLKQNDFDQFYIYDFDCPVNVNRTVFFKLKSFLTLISQVDFYRREKMICEEFEHKIYKLLNNSM